MRTAPVKKAERAPSAITGISRQAPTEEPSPTSMDAIGVAGVKISSGFVHDEFIVNLVGERGRKIYREMRDNDATVGAILFAIEMLLKAVPWTVEYDDNEDDEDAEAAATPAINQEGTKTVNDGEQAVNFIEGLLFDDMSHTWDDFIATVLSMLPFGWQYTEIVWKRRLGPSQDPVKDSIYSDGLIGIHKLADRSQETLDRWDMDDQGTVWGMWQQPPNGGEIRYIPMAKALLFRTNPFKDSPEGRSMLRTAYRSWYFLKNIQEIESIAVERELTGLPVVRIPDAILNGATDEAKRQVAQYTKMVRDVKFNEQGGIVLASDPYYDAEGTPTSVRQVEFELVTSGGSRAIDTDVIIKRYQGDIARTVLAQFILLSQAGSKGGYSQSKSEIDLFLGAGEGFLASIASIVNRDLIPKIWKVNGLDPQYMPYCKPGALAPDDLGVLGEYVSKLAAAGISLFDEDTSEHLRDIAGLPKAPEGHEDEALTFETEGLEDET